MVCVREAGAGRHSGPAVPPADGQLRRVHRPGPGHHHPLAGEPGQAGQGRHPHAGGGEDVCPEELSVESDCNGCQGQDQCEARPGHTRRMKARGVADAELMETQVMIRHGLLVEARDKCRPSSTSRPTQSSGCGPSSSSPFYSNSLGAHPSPTVSCPVSDNVESDNHFVLRWRRGLCEGLAPGHNVRNQRL